MRSVLLLSLFIIVSILSSCNSSNKKKQKHTEKDTLSKPILGVPKTIPVKILDGFFIKNTIEVKSPALFEIIESKRVLENYLGIAKTIKNKISKVNFSEFNVALLALPESNKETTITVSKITHKGTGLIIDYVINQKDETQSFSTKPFTAIIIPKGGINSVAFNNNDTTIKTINLN